MKCDAVINHNHLVVASWILGFFYELKLAQLYQSGMNLNMILQTLQNMFMKKNFPHTIFPGNPKFECLAARLQLFLTKWFHVINKLFSSQKGSQILAVIELSSIHKESILSIPSFNRNHNNEQNWNQSFNSLDFRPFCRA